MTHLKTMQQESDGCRNVLPSARTDLSGTGNEFFYLYVQHNHQEASPTEGVLFLKTF